MSGLLCKKSYNINRNKTSNHITLQYIKFKAKNAEALQPLYKHSNNLDTQETTPRIKLDFSLV